MSILSKHNLVDGFILNNCSNTENAEMCITCVKSKITKLPFAKHSKRKTSRPLELVHSDICGPITPSTYDGKRYFLTFLDDYTHFTIVYLLSSKAEMFDCFKEFEATVSAKFGNKIASLCCDNGGEYLLHTFVNFCKQKGIQIKNSIPYTPELNGKAERLNRTLLDKARDYDVGIKSGKDMWGEAILCAAYLANRSPTSCLKNSTPAEMFYGKKLNLKNLRIFGCVGYKHIPKEKQNGKFNARCDVCIMVGYTHNGYRLWDVKKQKVVVARDVLFDETKTIKNLEEKEEKELCTEVEMRTENNLEELRTENNLEELQIFVVAIKASQQNDSGRSLKGY